MAAGTSSLSSRYPCKAHARNYHFLPRDDRYLFTTECTGMIENVNDITSFLAGSIRGSIRGTCALVVISMLQPFPLELGPFNCTSKLD